MIICAKNFIFLFGGTLVPPLKACSYSKKAGFGILLITKRHFSSQKACALMEFVYICKRQQSSAYEKDFGVDMFSRVSCHDIL